MTFGALERRTRVAWIRMAQAARAYGLTEQTMREWVRTGRVRAECRDPVDGHDVYPPLTDAEGRLTAPPGTIWYIETPDEYIEAAEAEWPDEMFEKLATSIDRLAEDAARVNVALAQVRRQLAALKANRPTPRRQRRTGHLPLPPGPGPEQGPEPQLRRANG